jgi:hypothetical protein
MSGGANRLLPTGNGAVAVEDDLDAEAKQDEGREAQHGIDSALAETPQDRIGIAVAEINREGHGSDAGEAAGRAQQGGARFRSTTVFLWL